MLKPVKILDVRDATSTEPTRFIKPKVVEFERDGIVGKWESIKVGDSVHILVVDETNREILFVKQVRIPVLLNDDSQDGVVVECCAGLVDKQKPLICIAQEEILEELGYDCPLDNIKFVKSLKSSVGSAGSSTYLYIAKVTEAMKVNDGGGLESEDIEVVRLPFHMAYDYFMSDKAHTDATTMFLVTYWLHFG